MFKGIKENKKFKGIKKYGLVYDFSKPTKVDTFCTLNWCMISFHLLDQTTLKDEYIFLSQQMIDQPWIKERRYTVTWQ